MIDRGAVKVAELLDAIKACVSLDDVIVGQTVSDLTVEVAVRLLALKPPLDVEAHGEASSVDGHVRRVIIVRRPDPLSPWISLTFVGMSRCEWKLECIERTSPGARTL